MKSEKNAIKMKKLDNKRAELDLRRLEAENENLRLKLQLTRSENGIGDE